MTRLTLQRWVDRVTPGGKHEIRSTKSETNLKHEKEENLNREGSTHSLDFGLCFGLTGCAGTTARASDFAVELKDRAQGRE